VDKRPPDWELEGFNEAFRWWVDLDSPPRWIWETTRTVRGSLFGTFEEETLE
jgi:hypothetical protein